MKFSKTLVISSLVAFAAADAAPPASQCNVGSVSCCNSVQSSSNSLVSGLLGILGIVLGGVNVPIGLGCSPISVVGIGSGASCNASPVCCQNNTFNGLINIGCTPVNLSL